MPKKKKKKKVQKKQQTVIPEGGREIPLRSVPIEVCVHCPYMSCVMGYTNDNERRGAVTLCTRTGETVAALMMPPDSCPLRKEAEVLTIREMPTQGGDDGTEVSKTREDNKSTEAGS